MIPKIFGWFIEYVDPSLHPNVFDAVIDTFSPAAKELSHWILLLFPMIVEEFPFITFLVLPPIIVEVLPSISFPLPPMIVDLIEVLDILLFFPPAMNACSELIVFLSPPMIVLSETQLVIVLCLPPKREIFVVDGEISFCS